MQLNKSQIGLINSIFATELGKPKRTYCRHEWMRQAGESFNQKHVKLICNRCGKTKTVRGKP